jgi:cbb3-type cytochrome oxidase subunit 3
MLLFEKQYTDGSSIVFTLEPLFTEGEGTTIQPPNKKSKIDNYYAPQPESSEEKDDIEDAVSKSAASTTPYWEVAVYLENDDEEIYFSRKNYGVRFTQSAKLTLSGANREHKLLAAAADKLQILNFLNIAVKNSMMKTMKTFDKKSTHFYPLLQDQNVLMNSVRTYGTPWVAPVTGIRESAHLLGNDNLVLMANYCINWATRKEKVVKEIRGRVTILGVEVGDGRREVSDDTLERIVTELKKIRFHIEYDKGDKWVQMMKEKNKDDREIEKGRRFTKKGSLRLFKSIDETPSILKTAYDGKASFEVLGRGEGEETKVHTQATYYEQKGVKVEYPYLPIVRVSKGEWFPIEFLTQGLCFYLTIGTIIICNLLTHTLCVVVSAFGPKKMANENAEATRCALQFNDEFTGTRRVFQTQKLVHPPSCIPGWNDLSKSAKDRTTFFDKLNLEVEQQPYKIPAAGKWR